MFSTDIELEIKEDDKSGLKYFKITDQGTGMNRYVLERYLTTIGRSFYTSSDFTELGIAYSPISKFGIGFLSCFMLGKQVRVYTTHHDDPNTTFYLDIPNYDGCFFIEIKKNEEKAVSGSSITVWENSELKGKEEKFDIKKIRSYIKNIICNIPFDITLNKRKFIPKFNYYNNLRNETKKYEILFFIPLMSDSVVSDMDANNKILIDNGIDRHSEHGIYFSKKDKSLYDIPNSIVMNNGILVSQSNLKTEARGIHSYLDIAFNFPSYALELEVSRDKLKFLNNFDPSNLRNLLKTIIRKYLKSDSAKKLEYIFWCLLDRSMFKLSEINISITGNILNVKIEEHSPIEELECFCKLMKRSKENMREKRTNIYPRLFRFIFDEYNFHGQIFTYFNKQKKRLMKNSEKFIRSFQDKIIGFCFDYEKPNMTVLRNYADFATRFSKNPDKFIPILLAESSYEYHRNISGNRLQEKESNAFTYTRAMLVMTTMKYLLSIICTHSKLSEGFSIHLEGISVNESSDDS
jgi:predicted transcriptional regulator with HTH domain